MASIKDWSLTEEEGSLLRLLTWLSRKCAREATNTYLLSLLGYSDSTLKRLLDSLEAKGHIVRITSGAEVRGGTLARKRYILLASSAPPDKGAQYLATFVRDRAKPVPNIHPDFENVRSYASFLGPLRCTLDQFREWRSLACERGYLQAETHNGSSRFVLGRTPFEPLTQPEPTKWQPPAPERPLRDKIADYVRRNGFPVTLRQIADALGCGRAAIREEARKVEGLRERKIGTSLAFSFSPPPEDSDGRWQGYVIDLLKSEGPLTTADIEKRMGRKLIGVYKYVAKLGVTQTRFGNLRVWSFGPLSVEYEAKIRADQKRRKSRTNRDYYERTVPAKMPASLPRKVLERTYELLSSQPEVYRLEALWSPLEALCTPERIATIYSELRKSGVHRNVMEARLSGTIIDLYAAEGHSRNAA